MHIIYKPNNLFIFIREFENTYKTSYNGINATFCIPLNSQSGNLVYYSQESFIQKFEFSYSN